ncbi:MAG: hypothetical protein WCF12_09585, partial [Propionicimonas sp.]
VTLSARDFRLDTGAAGTDNLMVSFGSVGAQVSIGSLVIAGEGRNFAFTGNGGFKALSGFGVFLSVGSATGDSFKWPSFLPIRIDALGVQWDDPENNPGDFVLTLSASVTGIQGLGGLTFSGSIQGVKIKPALLAEGKFPIIAIDSLGVTVVGKMFGGELNAGLVGGILRLDANYAIIGTFDTVTPVVQRVFYLGIQGGFSIAGLAGFTIRLGLSELGPLQVFINVEVPGGILLEPFTGLSINDFAAGVEFFKSLPSLDDPFALRSSVAGLPTTETADTWLVSLQAQVALQARTIAANPGLGGFLAAFTAPMVITGSAKIFSLYTSEQLFNGQVILKISTDGKILIIGKLNFAADNLSISGRLYLDLSKIARGDATVLFLADIPDQIRLLSVYGKLKMGFKDSSGNDVSFSVVDAPDPAATGTAPSISVGGPAGNGGTVDGSAAGSSIDVVFTAPDGASLDLASILDTGDEFTITLNGTALTLTSGTPVPLIAVTTATGILFVPLVSDGTKVSYSYLDAGTTTTVTVLTTAELAAAHLTGDLLTQAIRLAGVTRFRYTLSAPLGLGVVQLSFGPGAVKNADVTVNGVTTTGAASAALDQAFTVTGVSATVTNPTAGATVDVNVINGRGWNTWLDVSFTPPTGRSLDLASLLDLGAEFTLSGSGLGTVALESGRAPILVSSNPDGSVTVRYWVTGLFAAAGTVTVTPTAGSWSLVVAGAGRITVGQATLTSGQAQLVVTMTAGLDAASVVDVLADLDVDAAAAGIQLYSAGGVVVTLDASRSVQALGDGTYAFPITVTGTVTGSVSVTLSAAAGQASQTVDAATVGTVAAVAVTPHPTATSYLDVTFSPSAGTILTTASITGDEISLSGAGLGTVALLGGTPLWLYGTTYRYLLTGSFSVGVVNVTVKLDAFSDNSGRSPPPGSILPYSFTVVGATADAAVSGTTIGTDVLNALHYLEIIFRGSSGYGIDTATINGGEIQFRDAQGTLIALGAPVRVGATDTYRYSFTATLAVGRYTISFIAGSFADLGGRGNVAETEHVTLATPTATLANPVKGQVLDAGVFNGRGYLDITFADFDAAGVDPASLLDAAAEFTLKIGATDLALD